jgi:hypothetical protein
MYLFNSTEWCYIKRTTDNVLQILLQASRWRVKTANTIVYIKRTTDNVPQILLQASRWRVKTTNTTLQIPWRKVKSYATTPTWSKNSANSQCKAWICKKKYHVY